MLFIFIFYILYIYILIQTKIIILLYIYSSYYTNIESCFLNIFEINSSISRLKIYIRRRRRNKKQNKSSGFAILLLYLLIFIYSIAKRLMTIRFDNDKNYYFILLYYYYYYKVWNYNQIILFSLYTVDLFIQNNKNDEYNKLFAIYIVLYITKQNQVLCGWILNWKMKIKSSTQHNTTHKTMLVLLITNKHIYKI